jgi:hypothetical protein
MKQIKTQPIVFHANLVLLAIAAMGLGGCVDTSAELAKSNVARPRLVARPGVSPRGASVAIAGVEGAPEDVASRFSKIFSRVADSRDIATAPLPDANYRVRGYLSAYAGEGGTRYSYVWDVFDRDGRRAQRLTDEIATRGEGDPWINIDEKILTDVAARGADDLAAFLSNTTEAIAAAAGGGAGVSVAEAQRAAPSLQVSPSASSAPHPLGFAQTQ